MRPLYPFLLAAAFLLALPVQSPAGLEEKVHRWGVYEHAFRSDREYGDPPADVTLSVELTAPSGAKRTAPAFWDGGREWRVRFSPEETGRWRWRSTCSDAGNRGLHDRIGSFECVLYLGDNPLFRRGPLRVSPSRTHFVHADGTPFFWLADTAWNGALRARREDWERYLDLRREQKFTAIQFVTTQWRGARQILPDRAYATGERLTIDPAFFRRLDPLVDAVNRRGLVAAPVVLWALTPQDPGQALREEDAVRLARYIVARWGAHQVVWLLGGDGNFEGPHVERWRRIGRAVLGVRPEERTRLATLHPRGQSWVGDEYRAEPWLDFIGYQSGHGGSEASLRWLTAGPPAREWRGEPLRPVVNLEPNYETHPGAPGGGKYTAYHVRRAAYWSLLVHPPAGVSYGNNPIWVWNERPAPAEGHERQGVIGPWTEGLRLEGILNMTRLREFFESGPWTGLRPAPELLAEQPGGADPNRFIAAARAEDGTRAVLYLPLGGEVKLNLERLKAPITGRWLDPRTGQSREAGKLEAGPVTLRAPGEEDWVLDLRGG